MKARRPAFALLLTAPFLGETLSTATPPLDLIQPWRLPVMVALYGCGALICRELTHRYRLGLPGLCLLAAAYAVYEEALVDRFWFDPRYWDSSGVGSYSEVWHTNLLIAAHLTAFHVAVSICSSVLLVARVFPASRQQDWVSRPGLTVAGLALLAVPVLTYADFARVPAGQLFAAGGLCVLFIGCAFLTPRLPRRPVPGSRTPRPRLLGLIAFVATAAHFVLVYTVPSTGVSWPIGTAAALLPIALAVLLIRRLTTGDGLWVVTGILAFFLVLDAVVGLGGRYDLTIGALAATLALWWIHRRSTRAQVR
ncbi:hypothetical protein ACWEOZ_29880 [Actinoplanes sp. NPDC004185]